VVIARSLPAAAKVAGGGTAQPAAPAQPAPAPATPKSGGSNFSLATLIGIVGLFVGSLGLGWLLGKRLRQ
jgi:hypothetical protein